MWLVRCSDDSWFSRFRGWARIYGQALYIRVEERRQGFSGFLAVVAKTYQTGNRARMAGDFTEDARRADAAFDEDAVHVERQIFVCAVADGANGDGGDAVVVSRGHDVEAFHFYCVGAGGEFALFFDFRYGVVQSEECARGFRAESFGGGDEFRSAGPIAHRFCKIPQIPNHLSSDHYVADSHFLPQSTRKTRRNAGVHLRSCAAKSGDECVAGTFAADARHDGRNFRAGDA